MSKYFRPWNIDQTLLLPPNVQDFVPKSHVSRFIVELVRESLDLKEITGSYVSGLGQPPFDPRMMVALLLHGYASGLYSSRRIARACRERNDFVMIVALEPEAKRAAEGERRIEAEKEQQRQAEGRKKPGKPAAPSDEPNPKAQRNFTDPESRIMKSKDGFVQAYNAQAAVDAGAQIIVAHELTQCGNDQRQLVPLIEAIENNLGRKPEQVSADSGYCSEANLEALEAHGIDGYVAPGRAKHPTAANGKIGGPLTQQMRKKIDDGGFETPYRLRKQVVEPVFGQIKQARGFRQFLLRGVEKVRAEWAMICTAHNLLKLFTIAIAA